MALQDFLNLADDKLRTDFERKAPDTSKLRDNAVKRLEKAKAQWSATEPVKGRKMFRVANDVVELSLPFEVSGRTSFYVPSERFADALDKLIGSVKAGELDDALATDASAAPAPKAARKPRADAGAARAGWSPERRARFEETVKARQAAKAA